MGDNNKKYSGFGYVVNPTRMWYNNQYYNNNFDYYTFFLRIIYYDYIYRKERERKKTTKIPHF